MRNRRNYYRILHIQPDAAPAIVRSSYRALMLQLEMHPDRGGDHWTAALINEAYEVLSDEQKRAAYDRRILGEPRRAARQRDSSPHDALARYSARPASQSEAAKAGTCCVFCQRWCEVDPLEDPSRCCTACHSPLYPAHQIELGASGNRAADRLAGRRKIKFYIDWPQDSPLLGMLEDVSPRGLRLASQTPLDLYQIVKIDAGSLQAVGRVAHIHSRRSGPGRPDRFGIEFFTVLLQPGLFITRSV